MLRRQDERDGSALNCLAVGPRSSGAGTASGPSAREASRGSPSMTPSSEGAVQRQRGLAPDFRFAFFSRLSYWCDIRCAWICAVKSMMTTTTINSEVPPK